MKYKVACSWYYFLNLPKDKSHLGCLLLFGIFPPQNFESGEQEKSSDSVFLKVCFKIFVI